MTFDEVAEKYFDSSEARNKSNRKYKLMYIKHIKDILGDKTLDELESSLIYRLQSKKKKLGLAIAL